MTIKLVILNGIEAGVEIGIELGRIYSIGNSDDSDFYLQSEVQPFQVFLKVVEGEIQWWANKKTDILYNEEPTLLSFSAQSLAQDSIVKVAGREFGVFSDMQALNEAKAKIIPMQEEPEEEQAEPESEVEQPPPQQTAEPDVEIPIPPPIAQTEQVVDEVAATQDEPIAGEASETQVAADTGVPPIDAVEAQKIIENVDVQDFAEIEKNRAEREKAKEKIRAEKKKDTLLKYAKMAPFVLGIVLAIGYATLQYQKSSTSSTRVESKDKKDRERAQASTKNGTLETGMEEGDLESLDVGAIGPGEADENTEDDLLYASGAEYGENRNDWETVSSAETSSTSKLEALRQEINNNTFDEEIAKEMLFPDEKMMTLIKEMLDTAGAQGIDVRFDRGSYDVFGFVMDDAKWQRIYKILTFDLDLTKVRFSVETSISLLNKFELLLKKFNLSEYVVLNLSPTGEILAKTYYPPALEGLWLTIVNRYEERYREYTRIKEYRAHVGWIQVVKVSFDQPSYVLLLDGRRVVEGSVIGGDSVLDRIFEDSIRVTSASTNIRYYVINRQTGSSATTNLSYR